MVYHEQEYTTESENTMKPMLDPKRDLAGATPETLVRALLRRVVPLRPPRPRRHPGVGDEVAVEKGAPD